MKDKDLVWLNNCISNMHAGFVRRSLLFLFLASTCNDLSFGFCPFSPPFVRSEPLLRLSCSLKQKVKTRCCRVEGRPTLVEIQAMPQAKAPRTLPTHFQTQAPSGMWRCASKGTPIMQLSRHQHPAPQPIIIYHLPCFQIALSCCCCCC